MPRRKAQPLEDIRLNFTPLHDSELSAAGSSIARSHIVLRGRLAGSSKIWINKEMRDPVVARREFLAQEFLRLINPYQPETRLMKDGSNNVHYIFSEEVKGFRPLPEDDCDNFANGTYRGLGQAMICAMFIQEADFKNGNVGLDRNGNVIKIDGYWAFSSKRKRKIGKQFDITDGTISSLPFPADFYTFNWLDLVEQGMSYSSSLIVESSLSREEQFQAEVNQAMLKICLLPKVVLQSLVDECFPAGGGEYLILLQTRKKILTDVALNNASFRQYLGSKEANVAKNRICAQMIKMKVNGEHRLLTLNQRHSLPDKLDRRLSSLCDSAITRNRAEMRRHKSADRTSSEHEGHGSRGPSRR